MKVIEINQKDEKFYEYLGSIFGSREIETKIGDRIYDDKNKEWYLLIEKEIVLALISIVKSKIKNIYGTNERYVSELLKEVMKKEEIQPSIVTRVYIDSYKKCNFIIEDGKYKNFVKITRKEGEEYE